MSLTSEDIKQVSSQVEKLTTMGAPFEVVMQADEIIDRGETLLESSRTADSLHSSQVVFDTTGIDDSQAGILAFGKYTFGVCIASSLAACMCPLLYCLHTISDSSLHTPCLFLCSTWSS